MVKTLPSNAGGASRYHLYVLSKKYNKLVNITKRSRLRCIEQTKLPVESEKGEGQHRVGELRGTNY